MIIPKKIISFWIEFFADFYFTQTWKKLQAVQTAIADILYVVRAYVARTYGARAYVDCVYVACAYVAHASVA